MSESREVRQAGAYLRPFMTQTCELLFSRRGEVLPKIAAADARGAFRHEWLVGAEAVTIHCTITFYDSFPNTTICVWERKAFGPGRFVREGDELRLNF